MECLANLSGQHVWHKMAWSSPEVEPAEVVITERGPFKVIDGTGEATVNWMTRYCRCGARKQRGAREQFYPKAGTR